LLFKDLLNIPLNCLASDCRGPFSRSFFPRNVVGISPQLAAGLASAATRPLGSSAFTSPHLFYGDKYLLHTGVGPTM
jgi:hypothetical protein